MHTIGGRRYRRLTVTERAQIAAAYTNGASIRDLTAEHDASYGAVRDTLLAAGITLRPPGPPANHRRAQAEGDHRG